jgi:MOSC domain-containing protein YiiM
VTEKNRHVWRMSEATVTAILISATPSGAIGEVEFARAISGRGLEGDRYAVGQGTFSDKPGTGRQVTLIEAEALEAYETEFGETLSRAEARRNIVTRGVRLNELVGREFLVGSVRVLGCRLCEPCTHLERLTGKPVLRGLVHRGGLRAEFLSDGVIRVGDPVVC